MHVEEVLSSNQITSEDDRLAEHFILTSFCLFQSLTSFVSAFSCKVLQVDSSASCTRNLSAFPTVQRCLNSQKLYNLTLKTDITFPLLHIKLYKSHKREVLQSHFQHWLRFSQLDWYKKRRQHQKRNGYKTPERQSYTVTRMPQATELSLACCLRAQESQGVLSACVWHWEGAPVPVSLT